MGVIFPSGYSLPAGDMPLTHARIAHAGNWLSGTPIASTTETGYFADAPNNSLTYERWKPTAFPATWDLDPGGSTVADYCCIGAHTLGSSGCSLAIQYFNGSWTNALSLTAIADDSPIMVVFTEKTATKWRVYISGGTFPEVGIIKFGKALQMYRPLYGGHSPLVMARQTVLRSNYSETGEFLGRTKQRTQLRTSFSWSEIPASWMRTNWLPFQKAIEAEPFFIAWRPGTFSEVGLCQADSVPVPENQGVRDLMSVQLTVRGYAHD